MNLLCIGYIFTKKVQLPARLQFRKGIKLIPSSLNIAEVSSVMTAR